MDKLVVVLLTVLVLPVLLVGGLLRWFWQLSKAEDLDDQLPSARWWGLVAIASVASMVFYGWLDTVTQPTGTPHGPSVSTPPQHHYDVLWWVLLPGVVFVLLLAVQSRRQAALSFGSGLLLALSAAGVGWHLYFAHEKQVYQAQMVDYKLAARNDSLQRLPNGFYGRRAGGSATDPHSDEETPTFPGGEPALRQAIQNRINYQAILRKYPLDTEVVEVQVEFIVETDGRITCAHVSEHHNFACDAEAVRVVNSLPHYKPGLQKGRPIAVSWYTSVLLYRQGAAKQEAY